MAQEKGYLAYKKYWEDQASFMDKLPWDKEKILKLTISNDFKINFEDLEFSNHSLSDESGSLTLRLKVPYNYFEVDDFKVKAIELLGIEQNWLTELTIENSHCTYHLRKQK